jgi:hypothetical protein
MALVSDEAFRPALPLHCDERVRVGDRQRLLADRNEVEVAGRLVLLKRAPPSLANGLPCRHDGRRRADGEEERHCPQKSGHVSGRQSVEEDGKYLPDANCQREAGAQANSHEPRALAEHHVDYARAWSPKRETNGEENIPGALLGSQVEANQR